MKFKKTRQQGFTLVEMAMVLVILGFVLAALLLPLQAQRQQLAQSQTENTLESAKQALLGYAQQQGRLPCPATNNGTAVFPDDAGAANPLGGTHNIVPPNPAVPDCVAQSGFLPAATLGLQPTDSQGFALDAWNNRIRYAVAADNSSTRVPTGATAACGGDTAPDFTTTGNLAAVGLACLAPELRVCNSATGITPTNCSAAVPEVNYAINNAVAVIYSTGQTEAAEANTLPAIVRPDETENLNAAGAGQIDAVFVSRNISIAAAPNEFDHLVVWISPFVLYNEMIQAGQLH